MNKAFIASIIIFLGIWCTSAYSSEPKEDPAQILVLTIPDESGKFQLATQEELNHSTPDFSNDPKALSSELERLFSNGKTFRVLKLQIGPSVSYAYLYDVFFYSIRDYAKKNFLPSEGEFKVWFDEPLLPLPDGTY